MTLACAAISYRVGYLTAALGILGSCGLSRNCMPPECSAILGAATSYGRSTPSNVPMATAIVRRMWVPALDAGFDPQGLAAVGDSLLVSGYISLKVGQDRGQCRVYRVDQTTGATTGQFDVPSPCGHAGGIALAGNGMIYITDTHTLFRTPLADAFGSTLPSFQSFPLGPGLIGALAASGAADIWIGTYVTDAPGRIFQFPAASLAALHDGQTLTRDMAKQALRIPSYAQGAAIDPAGRQLWISQSGFYWGRLTAIDTTTGAAIVDHAAPPGIEGINFDSKRTLWAVSEAGARHNFDLPMAAVFVPFYPIIFDLDLAKLPSN